MNFLTTPSQLRGIMFMLLSTALFSCMHGLIRYVSADMHPYEIAFFRNLFGLIVFVPWLVRYGMTPFVAPFRSGRVHLHLFRAALNVVSMLCFFYALSIAPLAQVSALTFSSPVFACVWAVLLLGERIDLKSWGIILLGFAGTIVVLQPGLEDVTLGSALALTSAFVWSFALIIIKVMTRTDTAVTIAAYMNLLLAILTAVPAAWVWTTPTTTQFGLLVVLAACGSSAHILMNQALKEAESHIVLPLDFSRLIWATLIGLIVFAEAPGIAVWIGGAMIIASAAYVGERERRLRRGKQKVIA